MTRFQTMIDTAPRFKCPGWLRIGQPCRLPSGPGFIVDFDERYLVVATCDGIEARFPLSWITLK